MALPSCPAMTCFVLVSPSMLVLICPEISKIPPCPASLLLGTASLSCHIMSASEGVLSWLSEFCCILPCLPWPACLVLPSNMSSVLSVQHELSGRELVCYADSYRINLCPVAFFLVLLVCLSPSFFSSFVFCLPVLSVLSFLASSYSLVCSLLCSVFFKLRYCIYEVMTFKKSLQDTQGYTVLPSGDVGYTSSLFILVFSYFIISPPPATKTFNTTITTVFFFPFPHTKALDIQKQHKQLNTHPCTNH